MILKLIQLYEVTQHQIDVLFVKNSEMQKARDKGLKNLINQVTNINFSLCQYLDFQFRKGFLQLQDNEVEKIIDKCLKIFMYINNKDLFIEIYSQMMGKRLINNNSVNDEMEKHMVQQLSLQCGNNFIYRLSKMRQDIEASKKDSLKFINYLEQNPSLSSPCISTFEVKVLSKGLWSFDELTPALFSPKLQSQIDIYNKYYHHHYKSRILQWFITQGQGEVIFNSYTFVCSTIQIILLELLYTNKAMSSSTLQNYIPFKDHYQINLEGLCNLGIIVQEDQQLVFNYKFSHKMRKIVAIIQKKSGKKEESKEEKEQEMKQLDTQRNNIIDSILVRIMKSRKVLDINALIEECVRQIKLFKPQVQVIKKRIESLIEREYLIRNSNNFNEFIYCP